MLCNAAFHLGMARVFLFLASVAPVEGCPPCHLERNKFGRRAVAGMGNYKILVFWHVLTYDEHRPGCRDACRGTSSADSAWPRATSRYPWGALSPTVRLTV